MGSRGGSTPRGGRCGVVLAPLPSAAEGAAAPDECSAGCNASFFGCDGIAARALTGAKANSSLSSRSRVRAVWMRGTPGRRDADPGVEVPPTPPPSPRGVADGEGAPAGRGDDARGRVGVEPRGLASGAKPVPVARRGDASGVALPPAALPRRGLASRRAEVCGLCADAAPPADWRRADVLPGGAWPRAQTRARRRR